jgi:hypothetical protein
LRWPGRLSIVFVWSETGFAGNTFCISCRFHMGSDRFDQPSRKIPGTQYQFHTMAVLVGAPLPDVIRIIGQAKPKKFEPSMKSSPAMLRQ